MDMRNFLFTGFLFFAGEALSQVNTFMERQRPVIVGQRPDVKNVFKTVEKGVSSGSIVSFSNRFGPQVHVSITGKDEGYFSANQTTSVLQSYFVPLKPVSFTFSRFHEKGENPYATGRLTYIARGNQESVQIYVSLALHDSEWVIGQFNMY